MSRVIQNILICFHSFRLWTACLKKIDGIHIAMFLSMDKNVIVTMLIKMTGNRKDRLKVIT